MRLLIRSFLVWILVGTGILASPLTDQIASANLSAENGQFLSTIRQLRLALQTVQALEKESILAFFPASFETFVGSDLLDLSDLPSEDMLSVIFSRHYQGPDGQFWDVNVVVDDAWAMGVIALIEKPKSIGPSSGTKRIKVKGNAALEQSLPKERYVERNVQVGPRAVVNIIGHGLPSLKPLNDFSERINWAGLKDHLLQNLGDRAARSVP